MEIRYTERKPSEQAADFARDNGLTIKRLDRVYCAYKGGAIFASGSSYGVLLNRMREGVKDLPVTTVNVSPKLVYSAKLSDFAAQYGNGMQITPENIARIEKETADFELGEYVRETSPVVKMDYAKLEAYFDAITPKIATGEYIDAWLQPLKGPWLLTFALDSHLCVAGFDSRSDAVTFSRSEFNKARRSGRSYTSRGIAHV